MFDHKFYRTQLGQAALVSIAAMITFAVFSHLQHEMASADMLLSANAMVELA